MVFFLLGIERFKRSFDETHYFRGRPVGFLDTDTVVGYNSIKKSLLQLRKLKVRNRFCEQYDTVKGRVLR